MRIKNFVPEFRKMYDERIKQYLKDKFNLSNDLEVPRILKIVVNTGFGNSNISVQRAFDVVKIISCQYPVIRKAKNSIADFNIRENNEIGVKATCRGDTMYIVLQRLWLALLNGSGRLPLLKSSSIVTTKGICSITIGFSDATLFDGVPVGIDNIGCNVTIVSLCKNKNLFIQLLLAFGFPFVDIPYKYKIWEDK